MSDLGKLREVDDSLAKIREYLEASQHRVGRLLAEQASAALDAKPEPLPPFPDECTCPCCTRRRREASEQGAWATTEPCPTCDRPISFYGASRERIVWEREQLKALRAKKPEPPKPAERTAEEILEKCIFDCDGAEIDEIGSPLREALRLVKKLRATANTRQELICELMAERDELSRRIARAIRHPWCNARVGQILRGDR